MTRPPSTHARLVSLAAAAFIVASCASAGPSVDDAVDPGVDRDRVPRAPASPLRLELGVDEVQMSYLGSGGWMIEVGNDALMTAPHFSNPGMSSVLFGRIAPDLERIDRGLDSLRTQHTEAILVGHAHYDHLLDVPATARRHAIFATIYGSPTARNLIGASVPASTDVVAIPPDSAATIDREGPWYRSPSGRFRWMPIASTHSDHFWKVQLFEGEVTEPLDELPDRAGGWKLGATFAYLIEVLDDAGEPALRIYYNDAAATRPFGFPPRSVLTGDVPLIAILTAAGYRWEENYPEELIDYLSPRFVAAGHWENFFRPQDGDPRPIFGTFFGGFVERMNDLGVPWAAPHPNDRWILRAR